MGCPPERIKEIRAMATIVGGEVVYPPRSIMRSRAWMQTISARKWW
jgi:hypothetical protein